MVTTRVHTSHLQIIFCKFSEITWSIHAYVHTCIHVQNKRWDTSYISLSDMRDAIHIYVYRYMHRTQAARCHRVFQKCEGIIHTYVHTCIHIQGKSWDTSFSLSDMRGRAKAAPTGRNVMCKCCGHVVTMDPQTGMHTYGMVFAMRVCAVFCGVCVCVCMQIAVDI